MDNVRARPRSDAITGHKRANPFDDLIEAKRQRLSYQTKVDTLAGWLSAVQHLPPLGLEKAEDFLAFVALGVEFPHNPDTAQAVFQELIRCEAYTVFADVFEAYRQIPPLGADGGAALQKSTLVLQMPHEWGIAAPAAMLNAFAKVQVQRVEILPPPSDDDDGYFTVSLELQNCLLALLEPATTVLTELAVNASMDDPRDVAMAFENSKLQSIEFGWLDDGMPDVEDMENYQVLAEGLSHCRTLTHIGIHHPHFFALHTAIADFSPHGPQLESVSFNLGADHPVVLPHRADKMQIRDFMREVGQFETLTTVTGKAHVFGGANLAAAFIEPLSGHKALTTLEIEGGLSLPVDQQTLEVLPMVAGFSVSCPSLRHFKWVEGELRGEAGEDMRKFTRSGGDLAMTEASNALAMAMAKPGFRLESLTLNGLPFSSGVLNAFFASLKHNTTLRHLDLSHCHLDLRSTLILLEALKTNTTLETITLSEEFDDYYLSTRDGNVHGFLSNEPESDEYEDNPTGFTLAFAEDATDASRALAFAEFAELESHANQLFAAIAERNRRFKTAMAMASARRAPSNV